MIKKLLTIFILSIISGTAFAESKPALTGRSAAGQYILALRNNITPLHKWALKTFNKANGHKNRKIWGSMSGMLVTTDGKAPAPIEKAKLISNEQASRDCKKLREKLREMRAVISIAHEHAI